jgi:hypothetical protein
VNKVLKRIDFKAQRAVLSAILVIVGMIFLAPTITEKALAIVVGSATGTCGPEGRTQPCEFIIVNKELKGADAPNVRWEHGPSCTGSGTTPCTRVQWETRGTPAACSEFLSAKAGCDEEGSVQVKVGGGEASLYFINPGRLGIPNDCDVKILDAGPGKLAGSCEKTIGLASDMTYDLHSASK